MTAALPAELQVLLAGERAAHAATQEQLHQVILERDAAKAKLQAVLKRYFGRASEKLDPNQLALAWSAVEADQACHRPGENQPRRAGSKPATLREVWS
jgi:hypothetical protein